MGRSFGVWSVVASVALAACSGSAPPTRATNDKVEERVITERMPDGSVRRTTIRTTTKTVPAAPPPARPADPWPADPLVKYNVDRVNAYRAKKGLAPLLYDAKISTFAIRGSEQLARDHTPHAHFKANAQGTPPEGFGSKAAENQGDPGGVPALDPNAAKNGPKQIDMMLKLMMDEGPGGGHYDNMMNGAFRRIGVGLVYVGGKLYMTNDFSD